MHIGYGITFDSAGWWSFDNGSARNVIIFGVDNSSYTKTNTKFCFRLHYNADNIYLLVNGKEIVSLKLTIKMLTFQHSFVSDVYLMDLVILSLKKYLQMEMLFFYHSTTILLVNLIH